MIFTVEDNAPVIDICVPQEIPSIREMLTINCIAKFNFSEAVVSSHLTLTHPNGTNISRAAGTEISVILDSVDVTDAGEYTCIGEIVISDSDNNIIVVQSKENITLNSKLTCEQLFMTITTCFKLVYIYKFQYHLL